MSAKKSVDGTAAFLSLESRCVALVQKHQDESRQDALSQGAAALPTSRVRCQKSDGKSLALREGYPAGHERAPWPPTFALAQPLKLLPLARAAAQLVNLPFLILTTM